MEIIKDGSRIWHKRYYAITGGKPTDYILPKAVARDLSQERLVYAYAHLIYHQIRQKLLMSETPDLGPQLEMLQQIPAIYVSETLAVTQNALRSGLIYMSLISVKSVVEQVMVPFYRPRITSYLLLEALDHGLMKEMSQEVYEWCIEFAGQQRPRVNYQFKINHDQLHSLKPQATNFSFASETDLMQNESEEVQLRRMRRENFQAPNAAPSCSEDRVRANQFLRPSPSNPYPLCAKRGLWRRLDLNLDNETLPYPVPDYIKKMANRPILTETEQVQNIISWDQDIQ